MKTIIMLNPPRTGSTAVYNIFRKHPDVKISNVNQDIEVDGVKVWESHFWSNAVVALRNNPVALINSLKTSCPLINVPPQIKKEDAFRIWDNILEHFGGCVFDKSIIYLGNVGAMSLLSMYKDLGNDVRVFAFIRNPMDAISSMFMLYKDDPNYDTDNMRSKERSWLQRYTHLEDLIESKELGDIPLYKYEDFCGNPSKYCSELLDFCGLKDCPEAYDHIRQVNVGRHSKETHPILKAWTTDVMSEKFKEHMRKYGYLE